MSGESPAESPVRQWARLREDVRSVLRRGAWYRVLRMAADDAILDVDNAAVRVPRSQLQITDVAPSRWTIVPRPRDAEALPASWGDFYAVCPSCAARAPLGARSPLKRCTRCDGSFEVAWDEGYLKT